MKPRNLSCLAATSALLLPFAAFGQTSTATRPAVGSTPSQQTYGTMAQQPGPGAVTRVNQDQRSRTFTARDLIGKNVHNHEGERLGTINDVALSRAWVERFGPPEGVATAGTSTTAALEPNSDLLVYISTGGVLGLQGRLGVRADWVSVSADHLLFDRNNDRFILNMPHEQFSAIAQGRAGDVYAGTSPGTYPSTPPPPSSRSGSIGSGTIGSAPATTTGTIGGSNVGDGPGRDLRRIEDALTNNSDLRGRSRIQVSHTGTAVQLSGEVETAELLRRAGDIARQHTDLEVRNYLEVARPFATE